MQNIILQVHNALLKSDKTIAAAESCTAGLASSLLTQLPDSSKYFLGGVIAYDNKIKTNILKIPSRLIAKYGAVSGNTAARMSRKIRKLAHTDYGLSITGIAGPAGGTTRNPVGTVFIAAASKDKTICKKFRFSGSRLIIRKKAALKALELFYESFYRH